MLSIRKRYLYWIAGFILLFFVFPNVFNARERESFSESLRLQHAKALSSPVKDSITVIPGRYYERGGLYTFFFGKKNRDLWTAALKLKVLQLDTIKGGLIPYELGGSQQTISVRFSDTAGRHWVLRSVNKDQQNALPGWLRHSALRSMFRDQVSSMNPFGPKIAAMLAEAVHVPHLHPELYWVPYNKKYGEYNERIAGRAVYLEEHLDSSWCSNMVSAGVRDIVDTDDMEEMQEKQKISIDTFLYLKTRLLDMLMCDWDRHEDQWRWALVEINGKKIFQPIAKDRDMALYVFDEGLLSFVTLTFNSKFQSFREEYKSVWGLMKQSKEMDKKILGRVSKQHFIAFAKQIQSEIDTAVIRRTFQEYPPAVYREVGKTHEKILASRLEKLTLVAARFYELVHE